MKNKLVISILVPLLTTMLGFYAGYHIKRDQAPEANSPEFNPFLFAGSQTTDNTTQTGYSNPLDLKGDLVRITNQSFRFETLPVRTQEEIYKIQLNYYESLKSVLEEFTIRFYNAINLIGAEDVDIEELPDPGHYFGELVTDEEVEQAYLKNLHQLREGMSPQIIKEQIRIELTIAKASNFITEKIEELKSKDIFELLFISPQAPLFTINYNDYYGLRNKNGNENKVLAFVSSFFCQECRAYNKQFEKMVQEDNFGYDFYFVAYSDHLDSPDAIAHHVSECIYQQNPNEFWKYYFTLFNFTDEQIKTMPQNLLELRRFFISLASKLHLDQKKLEKCSGVENKEVLSKIQSQILKYRNLLGARTPRIFVNDHLLHIDKAEEIPLSVKHLLKFQPSLQR